MDPQTYQIIGAGMEVHRTLGRGFLESVYQEALIRELELRDVPFESEIHLPVHYKGTRLRGVFRADLVCFGAVVVELKAINRLGNADLAQLVNYLKAGSLSRGLLLNFGGRSLEYRRVALSRMKSQ